MGDLNSFNEAQRRRILANAEYTDKLLADVEDILTSAESGRLFQRYELDVSPEQVRLIRSFLKMFRRHLGRFLETINLDEERRKPRFGALKSILVTLAFVRVAAEELAPEHLQGYGRLPPEDESILRGVSNELAGLVSMLESELARGTGVDIQRRLEKVSDTGLGQLLRTLERVITEEELPEFRTALGRLLDRLESPAFEAAVFGRVSSGKSSLLNRLVGTDVLPVGVTPVTAVPVRLVFGEHPTLWVRFAGGQSERRALEELSLFATEEYNPGNQREVLSLRVELPSSILQDGLTFVDTPGLGSLATAGAAQTLSYLPRCDLGIVLISAATPMNEEDLATLQLLLRSHSMAMVLLSKADLLSPEDLGRALKYTCSALRSELGVDLPVAAVSVADGHLRLLEDWRIQQLQPVLDRHKVLAAQSLRRKAHALGMSVAAALSARLGPAGHGADQKALEDAERALRSASSALENMRIEGFHSCDSLRLKAPEVLALTLELGRGASDGSLLADSRRALHEALLSVCNSVAAELKTKAKGLCATLDGALAVARRALSPSETKEESTLGSTELPSLPLLPQEFLQVGLEPPTALLLRPFKWVLRIWLGRRAGPAVTKALELYSRRLEDWLVGALAQMQQQFDAEAAVFRAEIQRRLAVECIPAERRLRIEAHLAELQAWAEPGSSHFRQTGGDGQDIAESMSIHKGAHSS